MSTHTALTRRGILAAGIASLATPALAQPAWPAGRPIEVVVGFAPGGGTDVMVRALAQFLAAELPAPISLSRTGPALAARRPMSRCRAPARTATRSAPLTRRATCRSVSSAASATTARRSA